MIEQLDRLQRVLMDEELRLGVLYCCSFFKISQRLKSYRGGRGRSSSSSLKPSGVKRTSLTFTRVSSCFQKLLSVLKILCS